MQIRSPLHWATEQELDKYFRIDTALERISLLNTWKKNGTRVPENILKGLVQLQLPDEEIIALFEVVDASEKVPFELWIMKEFLNWNQNIAAAALRAWARTTDRILWHRLIPVLAIPDLPQRVRYTILEIATTCHGYEITKACISSSGWEDLSPAFHALLMERALEFDIQSDRLIRHAWKIFESCQDNPHPEQKSLIAAQSYLIRFKTNELEKKLLNQTEFLWVDFLKIAVQEHNRRAATFSKLEKGLAKNPANTDFEKSLPAIWSRFDAPSAVIGRLLTSPSPNSSSLAGFSRSTILGFLNESAFGGAWTDTIISHLPFASDRRLKNDATGNLSKSYNAQNFPRLMAARHSACMGQLGISNDQINNPADVCDAAPTEEKSPNHPIMNFFDGIAGASTASSTRNSIWDDLCLAWKNPDGADPVFLSAQARKHKGIAHSAFILLLARMPQRDEAVLKLLDYIRSTDENQLRSVARALGRIDTPRSRLELISMLTRPNATFPVQQEIVAILARKNLKDLQKELRSAIQDLRQPQDIDHPQNQIRDELSSLLAPTSEQPSAGPRAFARSELSRDMNLDQELGTIIPHYHELSSEVRRALRTALFFNKTAANSPHADSIDLSPLIDMQYKAMELLYREFFEDMVGQSLQNGAIQRKLDVIGYARPIVRQMDEFESYIASLPVVRDIPFFSKFKLRKMLRAICQFEPGRRFTLDGLKAFGLYFLVFGRQSCKAGLANILSVGTDSDLELAEFCKELHVFQDFRNRAAHEGFHPDASNDIEGIWRTTASVVRWAFKFRDAQKSTTLPRTKKAS